MSKWPPVNYTKLRSIKLFIEEENCREYRASGNLCWLYDRYVELKKECVQAANLKKIEEENIKPVGQAGDAPVVYTKGRYNTPLSIYVLGLGLMWVGLVVCAAIHC